MNTVTHLAGTRIVIGQYSVQRCLLCGEVLDEFNARNIASPDGSPATEFLVGGFYEFSGSEGCKRMTLVSSSERPYFESDLDVPESCCVRKRWQS